MIISACNPSRIYVGTYSVQIMYRLGAMESPKINDRDVYCGATSRRSANRLAHISNMGLI